MSRKLITVSPEDPLRVVKEAFMKHKIHHLPVVKFGKILGMISKIDLQAYLKGANHEITDEFNAHLLDNFKADYIMTRKLAKVSPDDRLNVAVEVFSKNLFHALPVVKEGVLVGIITTHDIIKLLAVE
jgi:acetoin utilization protein AcuB